MITYLLGNYWTLKENSEQVFALIGPTPSWRDMQKRKMIDLSSLKPADSKHRQVSPQQQQQANVVRKETQLGKRSAATNHSIDHILKKAPKLSTVGDGRSGSCSSTPESSSSKVNESAASQLLKARIHQNLVLSNYWQQVYMNSLSMVNPRFYQNFGLPAVVQPNLLNAAVQPNFFNLNFVPQPLPPLNLANFAQGSAQNNHNA